MNDAHDQDFSFANMIQHAMWPMRKHADAVPIIGSGFTCCRMNAKERENMFKALHM